MSLRLVKPGLSAVTHPTLRDPQTGEALRALYVRPNGSVVWPVLGGSGEGEDDEDEEDDTSSEEGAEEGDDDDESDDPVSLKAKIKALTEEKERHYKRRKAAEAERDALRQNKQIKDEGAAASDDKSTGEVDKATKAAAAAQARARELQVENAFLKANKIDWHDAQDALKHLDMSEVDMDEDGNVDAKSLEAELRRLAKAKPYLVKSKAKTADGEAEDGKGKEKTSSKANRRRDEKGNTGKTREDLAKRFPALGAGR